LAQLLTRFARVIMFDKRGTGLSGRVLDVPTFEEQMDDVVAVMDATQSEAAVLLGVFDGAALAALFAATHPERTRGLVTWMLTPRVLEADDYPWGIDATTWQEWIEAAYQGVGPEDLRTRLDPGRVNDEQTQRALDRIFWVTSGPGGLSAFMNMWGDMDIRPVLPTIRVPTLVMQRAQGALIPADVGRYAASVIPGARYVELPGTANLITNEDSEPLADAIEEFITGSAPLRDPDRVLATVLFTDIVASTEHAERIGDHTWRQQLDRHDAMVRARLTEFGGREVNTAGDGFFATFDGPARAVRCARAVIDDAQTLGIELRAGVHTGECEVRGDDYAGIAIHIGARVAALATAGQVLTTRTVKDLVAGSGLTFADRGVHELKGITEPWHLYEVA
jgi:class 3 adenylate cyclase